MYTTFNLSNTCFDSSMGRTKMTNNLDATDLRNLTSLIHLCKLILESLNRLHSNGQIDQLQFNEHTSIKSLFINKYSSKT